MEKKLAVTEYLLNKVLVRLNEDEQRLYQAQKLIIELESKLKENNPDQNSYASANVALTVSQLNTSFYDIYEVMELFDFDVNEDCYYGE